MDKTRKNIFRWFGRVMRREVSGAARTVMELSVEGEDQRRSGRTGFCVI